MPHAVAANAKHLLSLLFYIDANNFSVLIILVCFRFGRPRQKPLSIPLGVFPM